MFATYFCMCMHTCVSACVWLGVVCNMCVQVHVPLSPLRPKEVIEYPSLSLCLISLWPSLS